MPHFFNQKELTDEQKSRWDDALTEYSRVQNVNFERKWLNITQEERDYYAKNYDAKSDDDIKQKMRSFGSLTGNAPGDSKSALFARLLDGKASLPFPPPTSYSYPWYSVIEDAGPHRVMLGGIVSEVWLLNGTRGTTDNLRVNINQCLWKIKSLNEAAQRLIDLDRQLQSLSRKEEPHKEWSSLIYDWTDDFLLQVKAAYADVPEFTVQYGQWTEYRLFVAQLDGDDNCHRSNKKYAKSKMNLTVDHLKRTASVFDLDAMDLNARIGKTISYGKHPKIRLEEAKSRYELLLSQGQFSAQFEKNFVDEALKNLEKDVLEFEENPDNEDWVEVFMDMWYLEKI